MLIVPKELKNPYYLGDEVGLTQTLGWVGAWTSRPSVYAVAAKSTADVVAAVNFARTHNLRLVVKGRRAQLSGNVGLAAANLLEAEVVTADGDIKLANVCANPDLFWALKGGGSGFGVVTRLTLRTHDLPEVIGGVFATIVAASDDAYRRLVAKMKDFYAQALFNPQYLKWPGRRAVDPLLKPLSWEDEAWRP